MGPLKAIFFGRDSLIRVYRLVRHFFLLVLKGPGAFLDPPWPHSLFNPPPPPLPPPPAFNITTIEIVGPGSYTFFIGCRVGTRDFLIIDRHHQSGELLSYKGHQKDVYFPTGSNGTNRG